MTITHYDIPRRIARLLGKSAVQAIVLAGVIFCLVQFIIFPEAQRLADEKQREVTAQVMPLDPATERELRRAVLTIQFASQAIARIEKRLRELPPCPCRACQK